MLTLTTKIIGAKDKFLSSALGNEIVMMDLANGNYFGLNEASSNIWNYLATEQTPAEIIDQLLNTYNVTREDCESETLACLNKMMEQGLIIIV